MGPSVSYHPSPVRFDYVSINGTPFPVTESHTSEVGEVVPTNPDHLVLQTASETLDRRGDDDNPANDGGFSTVFVESRLRKRAREDDPLPSYPGDAHCWTFKEISETKYHEVFESLCDEEISFIRRHYPRYKDLTLPKSFESGYRWAFDIKRIRNEAISDYDVLTARLTINENHPDHAKHRFRKFG